MEFNFKLSGRILGDKILDGIYRIDSKSLRSHERKLKYDIQKLRDFQNLIYSLGQSSAKAQRLPSVITSYERLRISDHVLYLLIDEKRPFHAIGFIRIGRKHLFLMDKFGRIHEVEPLCILDFYVHESMQRKGHGLKLFKTMLDCERIDNPAELAIDKPSEKFSSFLRKHYRLAHSVPQSNNYCVFDGFFSSENLKKSRIGKGFDRRKTYAGGDFKNENLAEIKNRAKSSTSNTSNGVGEALMNQYDKQRHVFVQNPVSRVEKRTKEINTEVPRPKVALSNSSVQFSQKPYASNTNGIRGDTYRNHPLYRERVRLPVLETKPTVMFNSEKWKHDNYNNGFKPNQIRPQDPYFGSLHRQNTKFREKMRDSSTNSGWNVFGLPRSFTRLNQQF